MERIAGTSTASVMLSCDNSTPHSLPPDDEEVEEARLAPSSAKSGPNHMWRVRKRVCVFVCWVVLREASHSLTGTENKSGKRN
jgi:hypothetical protein